MTYSRYYYLRTSVTADRAARRIVPLLAEAIRPQSVLDVGCGGGAWLQAWLKAGAIEAFGVDAASADDSGFALAGTSFSKRDLEQRFDLGRRFSVVQSLEVAEHLNPDAADGFIETLCRHGDTILFSAAPPGQGGIAHYNEQSYEYWRARFRSHGYRPIDWLRPLLAGDRTVPWWYRYNMLLYANEAGLAKLPAAVVSAKIEDEAEIPDIAPLRHRIRRLVLRSMPQPWVSKLARATQLSRWR